MFMLELRLCVFVWFVGVFVDLFNKWGCFCVEL